MPGYLLLRSNKESGPYALDQLITMGLKPYDLVWVEGKSAAWRYPGEIEELKPYAPVVEEQPYDRFYKKPVPVSQQSGSVITEEFVKITPMLQEGEPVIMANAKSIDHGARKYISVTMPKRPIAPIENSAPGYVEENPEAATSQFQKQPDIISHKESPSFEKPLVLEEKYSMPLDDIKQLYVENVLNKKNKKHSKFKVPGNVVILGVVLAFFALAITAGFFLTNGEFKSITWEGEKQPEIVQHTSFTQDSETTNENLPVTSEVNKPANTPVAGVAGKKQNFANKQPVVPQTLPADKSINAEKINDQVITEPEPSYPAAETDNVNNVISISNNTTPLPNNSNDTQPSHIPPTINDNDPPAASVQTASNPVVNTIEKSKANSNITDAERLWTKKRIRKLLVVDDIKYKTALLGGLKQVTASLTNHSKFKMDMVIVELDYLKSNDNTIKTEKLYFKNVLPDATVTLPAPNSTHGAKIDYRITLISSTELDYYYAAAY